MQILCAIYRDFPDKNFLIRFSYHKNKIIYINFIIFCDIIFEKLIFPLQQQCQNYDLQSVVPYFLVTGLKHEITNLI